MPDLYKNFRENPTKEMDNKVFVILPSEKEDIYLAHIKRPIEELKHDGAKLECSSYMDNNNPSDLMEFILKEIQRSKTIVVDITGYKPSVMYELGIAVSWKDSVLMIRDKTVSDEGSLPFDIAQLYSYPYDPKNLDELSAYIKDKVNSFLVPTLDGPPVKSREGQAIMDEIERMTRNGSAQMAILLFDKLTQLEPKNWYVLMQWGISLRVLEEYKIANEKLQLALDLPEISSRDKALITLEVAQVHISAESYSMAEASFEKAKALDPNNPFIYEQWAKYYEGLKDFNRASEKIRHAINLNDKSQELRMKAGYYLHMFLNKNSTLSYDQFRKIELKKQIEGGEGEEWITWAKSHMPSKGNVVKVSAKIIKHYPWGILTLVDGHKGAIKAADLPRNFESLSAFKLGTKIWTDIKWINMAKGEMTLKPSSKNNIGS